MGGPIFNQPVEGLDTGIGHGVRGRSSRNNGIGVYGNANSSNGIGLYGYSPYGYGVLAYGDPYGVRGTSHNGNGVSGYSRNNVGVYGSSYNSIGVWGQSEYGFAGVGAYSASRAALYGTSPQGYAAYLNGNVTITGTLQKGGGAFKIDHPLDPANKYLSHSFVESPDMKNVYDGVVALDEKGEAEIDHPLDPANKYLSHSFVESPDMKNVYDGVIALDDKGEAEIHLPDWFGALNKDFRYQLTAIGAPGPNLYIAEEIISDSTANNNNNGNRFKIAGGASGMKVSWQVTGIRKDPWANAHRVQVEEDKPDKERGYYMYPDLYGQPAENEISRLLFPELKQQLLINKNKLT